MSGSGDEALFATVLAGCRRSHVRLLGTVGRIEPDAVRGPSRLPDWTVGHVLSHLARNADSHTRMLRAALVGESVEQYAGGHEQRSADIGAGARRDGEAILDDVRRSVADLEDAFDAMTPDAWDGHGLSMGRLWPCRQVVFHRWREVELHHVDLGVGYEPGDWPADYVALELPIALAQLPDRLDDAERGRLLAWLVERGALGVAPALAPWQSVRYSRGSPFASSA